MNFRECVIDCIAESRVVQSFNQLHDTQISRELLSRLETWDPGQARLADLDDAQQQQLACFILFVHRHIWRKVKYAESRVTRVYQDRTLGIDLSRLEQVAKVGRNDLHG